MQFSSKKPIKTNSLLVALTHSAYLDNGASQDLLLVTYSVPLLTFFVNLTFRKLENIFYNSILLHFF